MCEIIKQKKRETSFEISRFFLPLQCLTSVLSLRTSGIAGGSFISALLWRFIDYEINIYPVDEIIVKICL